MVWKPNRLQAKLVTQSLCIRHLTSLSLSSLANKYSYTNVNAICSSGLLCPYALSLLPILASHEPSPLLEGTLLRASWGRVFLSLLLSE